MSEEHQLTPYETREVLFYKTDNGEVGIEILLFQGNLWLTSFRIRTKRQIINQIDTQEEKQLERRTLRHGMEKLIDENLLK